MFTAPFFSMTFFTSPFFGAGGGFEPPQPGADFVSSQVMANSVGLLMGF